ncbi:MAG: hypothetical protein AAGI71_13095 [Bacteroidota bacterium]
MKIWELTFTFREVMLDLALIGSLFLVATLARRYVGLFQRFLIPNSLIAGFLGLLVGPQLLDLLGYSTDRMEVYVYHLLTLTFISVGLQGGIGKRSKGALMFGFIQIMSFLLQVIVGLIVALAISAYLNPNVVPAVGTLLPLGFGMGPGPAYSIGQAWEARGFVGGGSVGLTIATVGFLMAYTTGVVLMNHGIRKGWSTLIQGEHRLTPSMRTGFVTEDPKPIGGRLTLSTSAIEPMTFHLALVGGVYLAAYGVGRGLENMLIEMGQAQRVSTLWGFHFILANILALMARRLMGWLRIGGLVDEGLMHRSTGMLSDALVATSILAISLSVAWDYIVPILIMGLLGAGVTYLSIRWVAQRAFDDYHFERMTGAYAQMTGNISSGLALIRVTDPQFETPVAQDLALGSGVAFVLGLPLFVLIELPFDLFQGRTEGYLWVIGLSALYLVAILLVWSRVGLARQRKVTFR